MTHFTYYSSHVVTLDQSEVASLIKSTNFYSPKWGRIKAGDLIMIYGKLPYVEILVHVAVALDSNLLFEKSNPDSSFLNRVATTKDSVVNVANSVQFISKIEVRRFHAKPPSAQTLFSIGKSAPYTKFDMTASSPYPKPNQQILDSHIIVPVISANGLSRIGESLYEINSAPLRYDTKIGRYQIDSK